MRKVVFLFVAAVLCGCGGGDPQEQQQQPVEAVHSPQSPPPAVPSGT